MDGAGDMEGGADTSAHSKLGGKFACLNETSMSQQKYVCT